MVVVSQPKRPQVLWVDALRGGLIVLVVLYHCIERGVLPSVLTEENTGKHFLKIIADGFRPLRMPLFFLVAGVLAVRAMERPWLTLLRSKVWFYAYLFVVWTVIETFLTWTVFRDVSATNLIVLVVTKLTVAPNLIWFLSALMVFYPLTKLLWTVRYVALVPSLATYLATVETQADTTLTAVAGNFLWFLIGATFSEWFVKLPNNHRQVKFAVGILLFMAPQALDYVLGSRTPWLLLLSSLGSLLFMPVLLDWCTCRFARFSSCLRYLGKRTLPIYVMHVPFLVFLWGWLDLLNVRLLGVSTVLAFPLLCTAAVIAVILGLYPVLQQWAPYLLKAPGARAPQAPPNHQRDYYNQVKETTTFVN